jgi:SHAQKYF class myb-like DNA-binding protein
MADPDEASAKLIAQMLREENPYGDDALAGYQDDSDDSDYGGGGKKKKKKKPPAAKPPKPVKEPKPKKEKPAPKAKAAPADKRTNDGGEGGGEGEGDGEGEGEGGEEGGAAVVKEEFTASGRRKRKDTGKTRAASRPWTEEEERLFREALVLHGRDWKKCAEHVGTRDARAYTSHAQKHFIKMCLQGKGLSPQREWESACCE